MHAMPISQETSPRGARVEKAKECKKHVLFCALIFSANTSFWQKDFAEV